MAKPADTPNPQTIIDFMNSLSEQQHSEVVEEFSNDARENWHYFPGRMWYRKGISIKDLNSTQRAKLELALQSYLSESGFQKTKDIMLLEGILGELTGNLDYRDPEKYYVAIYGDPSTNDPWSWTIEGHHLSLHFTVVNGQLVSSPRFFGANPAEVPQGEHKGMRVLNNEEDIAFQLLNSLSLEQEQKAILQEIAYSEIVTRNDSFVNQIDNQGVPMSELNGEQQELLWSLILSYLDSVSAIEAEAKASTIRAKEFNEILFAWTGAKEPGIGHYYRVQGKSFLIELDNTQNGANHIHCVWRDYTGDFGRDLIQEHYQRSHHLPH